MSRRRRLSDRDYARLLALRTRLRKFERWSAEQAASHGITAAQHQLLLAVRGHTGEQAPTMSEIAAYLTVGHNAAVGLVDRVQDLGLLQRHRDPNDHRVVRLTLTEEGTARVAALADAHIEELSRIGPMIDALTDDLAAR